METDTKFKILLKEVIQREFILAAGGAGPDFAAIADKILGTLALELDAQAADFIQSTEDWPTKNGEDFVAAINQRLDAAAYRKVAEIFAKEAEANA